MAPSTFYKHKRAQELADRLRAVELQLEETKKQAERRRDADRRKRKREADELATQHCAPAAASSSAAAVTVEDEADEGLEDGPEFDADGGYNYEGLLDDSEEEQSHTVGGQSHTRTHARCCRNWIES